MLRVGFAHSLGGWGCPRRDNGATNGAQLLSPPRRARGLRATVAAHGAAGVAAGPHAGVAFGRRPARAPLLVSAYAASEQAFMKPSSMSKIKSSAAGKAMNKNLNQVATKLGAVNRLFSPAVIKATYKDAKQEFADGFNRLTSLNSAEEVEQRNAKQAIKTTTDAIRKTPGLTVSRTHLGGSLGRRTQVSEAYDIDLIVFLKKYDGHDMTDLDVWRYNPELVTRMRRQVVKTLLETNPAWDVTIPSDAHYCDVLQVVVRGIQGDLLLVPDCVPGKPGDPVWQQHIALMSEVYANPARAEYDMIRERADAAALTEYVAGVHDDVKSVVRFVKGLYKYGVLGEQHGDPNSGRGGSWWPPEDDRIRSVSLEVLVLAADQQLRLREFGGRRPKSGNIYKLDLFLEFLDLLVAAVRDKQVVSVDAGEWGYRGDVERDFAHCWEGDAIRIIHPIDPTCNLERARDHRGPSNWGRLVRVGEAIRKNVRGGGTFEEFLFMPEVFRASFPAGALRDLPKMVARAVYL